jgi:hypothetical protein
MGEADTRECFKCGKAVQIAIDCQAKAKVKCTECEIELLAAMHDDTAKLANNRDGKVGTERRRN